MQSTASWGSLRGCTGFSGSCTEGAASAQRDKRGMLMDVMCDELDSAYAQTGCSGHPACRGYSRRPRLWQPQQKSRSLNGRSRQEMCFCRGRWAPWCSGFVQALSGLRTVESSNTASLQSSTTTTLISQQASTVSQSLVVVAVLVPSPFCRSTGL